MTKQRVFKLRPVDNLIIRLRFLNIRKTDYSNKKREYLITSQTF